MGRPTIICLTPVLNEAWILDRFLKCSSLWADHIIIADQGSTDGSREIACRFPKVILIDNKSRTFNEAERQQLLLARAREVSGPKFLLALDADEFLSANFLTSPEWETIINSPKGTVVWFQVPQIISRGPELRFFMIRHDIGMGFVDDGSEHKGTAIHSFRVPIPSGAGRLFPQQIKVMHYCQMDPARLASRLRWYECWEYLNLHKKPIDLYRYYEHDWCVPLCVMRPMPQEWIHEYERRGIDMTSVSSEKVYRWDKEVLQYLEAFGTKKFKRLPIWDTDWTQVHKELYPKEPEKNFPDPRTRLDKLVHMWLHRTQPDFSQDANTRYRWILYYRYVQKILGWFGW
jgi:glycosyltransferase involved in cell wall biosynthesis